MGAEYICHYLSDEGIVCGGGSTRPEGCSIHWKRRRRAQCKQDGCIRPTASKYGFCNLHVNKCHSKANYERKKMDKICLNGQTPEAMRQALDKITLRKISDTIEYWP